MSEAIDRLIEGNQKASDLHRNALVKQITESKDQQIKNLEELVRLANDFMNEDCSEHDKYSFNQLKESYQQKYPKQ